MDYPTAEEEFELMYGEELEMVEDDEMYEANQNSQRANQVASTQKTLPPNVAKNIFQSPQISQISRAGSRDSLIITPAMKKPNRFASTPFSQLPTTSEEMDSCGAFSEIQNLGLQRKRKLEDLFGDIYDIGEEDDVLTKKHRSEEDLDFEMIEKILQARKAFEGQLNPLKKSSFDRLESLHKFKKANLSRTVPKWPFLSIVKNDMDCIYVRFHSEEFVKQKLDEIKCYDKSKRNLLGAEQEDIWKEAKEIVVKRMLASDTQPIIPAILEAQQQEKSTGNVNLWVEKYKPKKYIDLLSDESTNRGLLQWLRLWDKVVFNREVIKKDDKTGPLSNFNKRTGRFEQNGGWRKKTRGNLNTDLDANSVPVQKIALLVGPPGLGKTTLAHTIANHAGYVVREMNASDDRNIDAFKQTLENGTQMSSVLNQDKRPNCIVLDEIDGAPIQSIEFLIRFVQGQVAEKSKKPGKTQKKFILKRPIICICNDMYGSNLRQLRQIAFVVNFPQIDNSRLAERLQLIANRERVKTDLTTMLALAEKTGNDVRSCLSMLQFYSGLKKPLTLMDVLKSNMGKKDQHKGLFSVWSCIFQVQRPRKMIHDSTSGENKQAIGMTDMSPSTRMANVLDMIHMSGDYDKLIQGVFENYLKQRMPDPNLDGVVEANQWFCFDDRLQNKINSLQNYSIYPYLSYGFVSWHYLFASMAYPKIQFPQKQYEVSQKMNTTKMVLNTLKKGIASTMKGTGDGVSLLLDCVSLIKHIISPEIRSVSKQLLTEKEKSDLSHVVAVMADLGLVYTQLQSADSTYVYRIEPDLELLGEFDVSSPNQQLSYWSKQTIAREVDLEHMRRARPKSSKIQNENPGHKSLSQELRKSVMEKPKSSSFDVKSTPNHLQKLIPKAIVQAQRPAETVGKDFFGRITSKSSASVIQNEATGGDVLVKSPIWFKFKEGFNNAVRTDIFYSDLL
ncbi:unnamed protein product [Diamesa serratosioi]